MLERSFASARLRPLVVIATTLAVSLSLVGCTADAPTDQNVDEPVAITEVILASTTSTQDSGLFDVLIPAFEEAKPQYRVKVIAVGTGEALALGQSKDADVLLVHAQTDEEAFVAAGFGYERADVMYNDYVVVGPTEDPAGLRSAPDTVSAMRAVAQRGAFVSRGDGSGTHKKELSLWRAAGLDEPTPGDDDWYQSTGQGMGETLTVASNLGVYTIADRATYLSMRGAIDLEVLYEGADELLNQYGVIVVTDTPSGEGAQAFFDWIISPEGQSIIETYGVDLFGQPLFFPNAIR